MTIDKKIDLILNAIASLSDSEIFDNIYNQLELEPNSSADMRLVKNKMVEEDLIEVTGSMDLVCLITPKGKEIYKNGGWLTFLDDTQLHNRRIAELERIEENKLRWEAKLAKWKTKTFWPIFIFGVIGGVCGILSLILNVKSAQNESEIIEKVIYKSYWNSETSTLELIRTNGLSPLTLNQAIDIVNFDYGNFELGQPFIKLIGVNNDTSFLKIDNSDVLTQQMGTTGANEFLAKLVYTITELESIQYVDLDFEEGDHAHPGTYIRKDFDIEDL